MHRLQGPNLLVEKNTTMLLALKNNGGSGFQDSMKKELKKGAWLLV